MVKLRLILGFGLQCCHGFSWAPACPAFQVCWSLARIWAAAGRGERPAEHLATQACLPVLPLTCPRCTLYCCVRRRVHILPPLHALCVWPLSNRTVASRSRTAPFGQNPHMMKPIIQPHQIVEVYEMMNVSFPTEAVVVLK